MTPEQPSPIPSRKAIENLIANEMSDQALVLIRKHRLQYKIVDGRLIDLRDTTDGWLDKFITINPDMLSMKEDIRKLSKEQDPVLITGETGTGKELIARALHGDREDDFLNLNCAGIPDTLVESELFGHVEGAFTGAARAHDGMMKAAGQGTLFMDEINRLPLSAQAKLLVALQTKKVRPVGSSKSTDVHCRIVCASNADLEKMYLEGSFQIDFYARISTMMINILPLRERLEDIEPILLSLDDGKEFLNAWQAQVKKLESSVDEEGEHRKIKLPIPFNVRSLQQHVRRFKVLGRLPI